MKTLQVTTRDLARAAFELDSCVHTLRECRELADAVLRRVLGVRAATGGEQIVVDLDNGYSLVVSAFKNGAQPRHIDGRW